MRRLSNLPIRWRLTVLYGGIITLILLVFSGGVYVYLQKSLQRSIDAKIRSMGEIISSSMTESHDPTLFGNFERYLENVLGRKPKGKLIQIMDSSGRVGAKSSDIEAENLSASFGTLERAFAGEVVYETVQKGGPRLRLVTIPVMDNKKVASIVQVGTSLEEFDDTMRRLLIILVVGIITSVSLTTGVGYFMAKKALRPVDKIRKAAVKISSRNLEEFIDIGARRDELGKLAETFNAMTSRLRDAFQRINQFSVDVSHELKTPLTILKGSTEVALRKERGREEYRALLASHLEEIDRMSQIIDDLLLLSKADTGKIQLNLSDIDLKDLILQVYMGMKMFAEKKDVELIVDELYDVRLKGDELKLRRMLWNIVENGIKYTNGGGRVEISSASDDGCVRINVRDTGVGIADEDIKYVFDRFYRADRARKRESGTGLGLSISKWIAEAHRGAIEVESRPSSGSLFSIKLPLSGGNE
jgi:heavy metal sensor kinase